MPSSRRDFFSLFPALCAFPLLGSSQGTLRSGTFRFSDLEVHKDPDATFRSILDGTTRSGFRLGLTEVFLLPRTAPRHASRHPHDELLLISQGEVEVTVAGNTDKLGPGSAAYVAAGEEHVITNVGASPAQYFEIEIGPKTS